MDDVLGLSGLLEKDCKYYRRRRRRCSLLWMPSMNWREPLLCLRLATHADRVLWSRLFAAAPTPRTRT